MGLGALLFRLFERLREPLDGLVALAELHLGETDAALASAHNLSALLQEGQVRVLQLQMELWGLYALTHLRKKEYVEAAAAAGNVERTLYWLDLVLSTPFGPPIAELRTSEKYAKVRSDPRFEDLLRKHEK